MVSYQKGIARGRTQRQNLNNLLDGKCIFVPKLFGAAKNRYSGSYFRGFDNFLARAEKAGYRLVMVPGPRFGIGHAHYHIIGAEKICGQCEEVLPRWILHCLTS